MKIFFDEDLWDKVNFVDEQNTFVGYDMAASCCETSGWYISDHRRFDRDETETIKEGLEGYVFDRDFFEEVSSESLPNPDEDYGGLVRFRLIESGKPDLFLHIFNSHNGYYAHRFSVEHSGVVVREGEL